MMGLPTRCAKFMVRAMRTLFTSMIVLAGLASNAFAAPVARDAWMRVVPGSTTAAGYVTIANPTDTPDALVAITSDCCEAVELHHMSMDGEVMRMAPVEKVAIGAQETVTLEPGGYHAMLIGMKQAPAEGKGVAATLVYESGAKEPIAFLVKTIGQSSGHHGHH